MTKKEIVDYVVETPHNVNKRILGQQLDEFQKNVSWNDLKDKPFYTEKETKPYTICENAYMEYDGEDYSASVDFDRVFTTGEKVCVTLSGGDLSEPVTYVGVAEIIRDDKSDVHFAEEIEYLTYCTSRQFSDGTAEVTVRANCNCTATVTLPDTLVEEEVVHKLDAKYLPNSVWAEEESFAIVDNAVLDNDGSGGSRFAFVNSAVNGEQGDILTVIIDGVEYTPVFGQTEEGSFASFDDNQGNKYQISNYPDGEENNWHIRHYGEKMSIILTRTTVLTNCDFMVDIKLLPNSIEKNLVHGDYATAKAKYDMGLPVTIYTCAEVWQDEGGSRKAKMRHIAYPVYGCYGDVEYFWVDVEPISFAIYPDNTVQTEGV